MGRFARVATSASPSAAPQARPGVPGAGLTPRRPCSAGATPRHATAGPRRNKARSKTAISNIIRHKPNQRAGKNESEGGNNPRCSGGASRAEPSRGPHCGSSGGGAQPAASTRPRVSWRHRDTDTNATIFRQEGADRDGEGEPNANPTLRPARKREQKRKGREKRRQL